VFSILENINLQNGSTNLPGPSSLQCNINYQRFNCAAERAPFRYLRPGWGGGGADTTINCMERALISTQLPPQALLLVVALKLMGNTRPVRRRQTRQNSPSVRIRESPRLCPDWLLASASERPPNKQKNKKQTPWPLVRERTIPTDRPPLVDEI
jgi:hypothetical protein